MPTTSADAELAVALASTARPLSGAPGDLGPLLALARPARFVLLGEASHGTHEFYRLRAELTRRLIEGGGVAAVAIEGDWPDAQVVNRCVRGDMPTADAVEALAGFRRFPAWMWRNADMLDFVGWLRGHNERHRPKVGVFGLDLYSLHTSMVEVVRYLDQVDPAAARRARERYACFEHLGGHLEEPFGTSAEELGQLYGQMAGLGLGSDCEDEVVQQLIDLQARRASTMVADDASFEAEQNALVVKNAEHYYRTMLGGRVSSWNLRDTHMADTLDALASYLGEGQIIVWAHNSHVGDARATQLTLIDELNLGQLTRQRHPGESCLVGFTTNTGTVTAASDWGAPTERMRVRPALSGSVEALFHRTGVPRFALLMEELGERAGELREPRLERAIGVVYRPETERQSHYFHARLPAQFDAVIHVDETRAVEPLERGSSWAFDEAPETFPSGL